jgi:ABC-type Fe3+ transport system substrate-binding protein
MLRHNFHFPVRAQEVYMQRFRFSFRKLIASIAVALTSVAAHAQDATGNKVVVMTSYPEEMVTLFKTSFEKTHPGIQIDILRRHSGEALAELGKTDQQNVDVYWAPAQRNFIALAKAGAFHHLDIPLGGLPIGVGGFAISDPAAFYAASEIAGYGFAVNPKRLQEKGLPQPADWTDLTDPKWKDEIAFPLPSKVGFAPLMIDIVLQGYGWEKGWSILQAIGSNAQLLDVQGRNISADVAAGRASVGLSIDFIAKAAIAKGAPMQFVYPGLTGYSPAHIAIMKNAPHLDNAQTFVGFVLSSDGQRLLFDPSISKLPVRPSVYAGKPDGYFNPFTADVPIPFVFNAERALARQGLNNALFDVLITNTQIQMREVMEKVSEAERLANASSDATLKDKARQARLLAGAVPFNAVQATGLVDQFSPASDSAATQKKNADLIAQWTKRIRQNRDKAEQLADQVISAAGKR